MHPAIRAIALLLFALRAAGSAIPIDPPGQHDFILDTAGLIDTADREKIVEAADACLFDTAIPIVTVTISSMADYGRSRSSIEAFARELFNQWGIGHAQINGVSWNRGILLLISRNDRKARIELGADWEHSNDAFCRRIMDEAIVPAFKKGDYSGGILAGYRDLEHMARGIPLSLPKRGYLSRLLNEYVPAEFLEPDAMLLFGGMLVFFVLAWVAGAYGRSRREGGSWYQHLFTQGDSGDSSGGDSGGSFDGGSSGGGGASGSW